MAVRCYAGPGARAGAAAEARGTPCHLLAASCLPAALQQLGSACRGEDVLRFPIIQQRRIFRIKKEVPLGAWRVCCWSLLSVRAQQLGHCGIPVSRQHSLAGTTSSPDVPAGHASLGQAYAKCAFINLPAAMQPAHADAA